MRVERPKANENRLKFWKPAFSAIFFLALKKVVVRKYVMFFSHCAKKCMLFVGWEVRIVKNCDLGLESAARGRRPRAAFSSPRSQFFTIRNDPKPVNNLFFFFPSSQTKKSPLKETRASVTVTVVSGDRKIRTALRANEIVGFVSVPAWKK